MIRLAANIDWLWKEYSLEQRLVAARAAGFAYIEAINPYVATVAEWKTWLNSQELKLALINVPAGITATWPVRGLAAWPGAEEAFRAEFETAMSYAMALDVRLIHVTAGPLSAQSTLGAQQACYEANLAWACELAQSQGVTVTIEPLSGRDSPGAFMASLPRALGTIEALAHPALRLQFDLYHQQILQGDIISSLRACIGQIAHIQVAGVPDRGEPDAGELNFERIAAELLSLNYTGVIGCEYRPKGTSTEAGLGWARPYLAG